MPARRLIVLICVTMGANTVFIGAFPALLPEIGTTAHPPVGYAAGAGGVAARALPGLGGRRDVPRPVLAGVLTARHTGVLPAALIIVMATLAVTLLAQPRATAPSP
jgi:hypothetical protein